MEYQQPLSQLLDQQQPQHPDERPKKTIRAGSRSRSGCLTCRQRKLKCDENRPVCRRCSRGNRTCDYTGVKPRSHSQERRSRPSGPPPVAHAYQSPYGPPALDPVLEGGQTAVSPHQNFINDLSSSTAPGAAPQSGLDESRGRDRDSLAALLRDANGAAAASRDDDPGLGEVFNEFSRMLWPKATRWSFTTGLIAMSTATPELRDLCLRLMEYHNSHVKQGGNPSAPPLGPIPEPIDISDRDPVTFLTSLYFLATFHLRYTGDTDALRRLLNAFKQAIWNHGPALAPQMFDPDDAKNPSEEKIDHKPLPPTRYAALLNRLGLYMVYLDISASTFDQGQADVPSLMRMSPAAYEGMLDGSKTAILELWGDTYPMSERLNNLQNQMVLELHHAAMRLRAGVADLRHQQNFQHEVSQASPDEVQSWITDCNNVKTKFSDAIAIGSSKDLRNHPSHRFLSPLRFAVAQFHATVLEFHRTIYFTERLRAEGQSALHSILDIVSLVHDTEGPESLLSLVWPLFLAGIETTDTIYQRWVFDQLQHLATFSASVSKARRVLAGVVARQQGEDGRVDWLGLTKKGVFPEFVLY